MRSLAFVAGTRSLRKRTKLCSPPAVVSAQTSSCGSWKRRCSAERLVLWTITWCASSSLSNRTPHLQFRDLTCFYMPFCFLFFNAHPVQKPFNCSLNRGWLELCTNPLRPRIFENRFRVHRIWRCLKHACRVVHFSRCRVVLSPLCIFFPKSYL